MVANNGSNEKPKATVGRKLKKKSTIEKTMIYCRKCATQKDSSHFFSHTDKLLDSNGYMSICRECIRDLYPRLFQTEHTLERAMLRLCRILNWKYSEAAINATIAHISTQGKLPDDATVPGIYKAKLTSTQKSEIGKLTEEDLTFVEPMINLPVANPLDDTFEEKDYLEKAWGKGLDFEDYVFLEEQFSNFKQTHKADTYSEIVLLREVCWKLLNISKSRIEGTKVDTDVKALQELMKSLAISPNMANMANSGKNLDTFGLWIDEIEREEPAQWLEHEGHEMYHDVGNVEEYFLKYFVRPLKNAILQSKEFNIDDDGDEIEEFEDLIKEVDDGYESKTLSE